MNNHLQNYLFRENVISYLRTFFSRKQFTEITLPLLYTSIPLEPNIYSFSTNWTYYKDNLYLATSPEMGLKLLMAQGLGDCFAISSNFRNLEAKGSLHQPEFTMLEWYQTNSDYLKTMDLIEILIKDIIQSLCKNNLNRTTNIFTYQNRSQSLSGSFPRLSFIKLFQDAGYKTLPDNEPDLNQIFLNDIEPRLPTQTPFFITDYPAFMSPLAKPNQDGLTAQRFELYFAGIEIANGCTENTDSTLITQHARFEEEHRRQNRLPIHPSNPDFAPASAKLPLSAGCGLGVDRLAMILSDVPSLDQIRPFPL